MKKAIINELRNIEKRHKIKIILASESGSRAWGFPSNDSDYDVRFIYVNTMDWYLSIEEKRDVIELPVDEVLDINGWDIRKALRLMKKSNSPLLEWLSSPIKYLIWQQAYEQLITLSKTTFLPETSCHHYLSMAKKKFSIIQEDKKVKLKTYMYAIRPVLCCEWIINKLTQPPMHISDLLDSIPGNTVFKKELTEVIIRKQAHSEGYMVDRSDVFDTYIQTKISKLSSLIPKNPKKPGTEEFDAVFKHICSNSSL